MKFLVLSISLLHIAMAADPIRFIGFPKAKSTEFEFGTVLHVSPTAGQVDSAQFPYNKLTDDSVAVGLATVFLNGPGIRVPLQTGFSVITQICSCYWLSASDLKIRFPQLTNSLEYFISIESPSFVIKSGTFGLDLGKAQVSSVSPPISETSPQPKPTVAPTVKPTVVPTVAPAVKPTVVPTVAPTVKPTIIPPTRTVSSSYVKNPPGHASMSFTSVKPSDSSVFQSTISSDLSKSAYEPIDSADSLVVNSSSSHLLVPLIPTLIMSSFFINLIFN